MKVAAEGFADNVRGGDAVALRSLGDLIVELRIKADGFDGGWARAAERGSSALAPAGNELGRLVAAFGFVGKGFNVGVGDDASG